MGDCKHYSAGIWFVSADARMGWDLTPQSRIAQAHNMLCPY
jgi:hypothetical protein